MLLTLPRDVAKFRHAYRQIAAQRVPDQAPLDQQHAYWRLHDAAKMAYAQADWRVQRALIRLGLLALAAATLLSVLLPSAAWLIGAAALFLAWRIYLVLRRIAPGEED